MSLRFPSWCHLPAERVDTAMDTVPAHTKCDECGKSVPLREALVTTKHFGHSTRVFHWCSENCANEYYLEKLRSGL